MAERSFDAIVIGAGPAGEVVAGRLAEGGLETAIVEHDLIGGECSYYACMPSKALLRPGQLLAEARRHPGVREAVTGPLDVAAALARRDDVIHHRDDGSMLPWLEDRGIALFRAGGRLDGERRVRAGDDLLTARRAVVVATGTRAAIPPVDGLRELDPWTNREATTAPAVPPRLAVLGGGVAGCELAQAYRTLGAEVTLVEMADRLLAREEPFAGDEVERGLREAGVDVRLATAATAAAADGDEVVLELDGGGPVRAERLLVAVGRSPNTDDLGLDSVGLEPGESIEVDDRLRAGGRHWLYAVGDVNGRALLTHMGKYQARIAADAILGRGDARIEQDGERSPRVVFTEPQVAAVGHTVATARAAGLEVEVVDVPTQANAGASFVGRDAPGTTRLVIDTRRRVIAGATFTGPEIAEMLHAATVAVAAEVPLERLAHAVPAFPTRSEVWLKLLEAAGP